MRQKKWPSIVARQARFGHQNELSDSKHYLTRTETTKEGQAFTDDLVCVSVCYFIYSSVPSPVRIITSEIKKQENYNMANIFKNRSHRLMFL